MSAICRLASRKLAPQLVYYNKPEFLTLARHVTLKAVPYKPPAEEGHDERNMNLGRPQSPFMIYAPQITSFLSISHRMTGAALAGYAFILGGGALVSPDQFSHYVDAVQNLHLGSASLFTMKFILAFPFTYHFCNGIRHLVWDLGKYLTIPGVYTTGYTMLGISFTLAVILSAM